VRPELHRRQVTGVSTVHFTEQLSAVLVSSCSRSRTLEARYRFASSGVPSCFNNGSGGSTEELAVRKDLADCQSAITRKLRDKFGHSRSLFPTLRTDGGRSFESMDRILDRFRRIGFCL